jgi:hypothetical protein
MSFQKPTLQAVFHMGSNNSAASCFEQKNRSSSDRLSILGVQESGAV